MSVKIQLKRTTASAWTSLNPTLDNGEFGYETDTAKFKIGNGSTAWTSLSYANANLSVASLDALSDVTITSATNGDFLRWNGSAWINDAVNLSTDTVGSYVESLVAGTGVTVTNNSGEGAAPTIAIGQDVASSATPTFAGLNLNGNIVFEGTTADAFETTLSLVDPTSDRTITLPNISGTVVTTGDTGSVTSTMIADGTIVNEDVNASAAIDHSKLANATAGQVLLGTTTTGVVTATTISGDITIDGAGVVSISANSVALGTDTTGNYVNDITAGTGITVTHTPGEGSSASIALNATLDNLSDVVITSPLQFQGLMYDGTNWVNSNIPDTYLVRNNTGSTILKGTLVGAVGAEPSGRIDIAPFEVTGTENSELRAMGIVTSNISSGVNGEVMSFGTLTGLDTRGDTASALAVGDETWAAGDILFAHPTVDGKLTNVRPQHDLAVAFITVRHASTGQIVIRIIPGNNHLEWMHDVSLVDKTSGDFLKYNGTVWVNDPINLGTDTVGNYVNDITAGTGVTVTHTPGEGSSPTVAIGQAVGTTDNVTFAGVTADAITIGVTAAGEIDTTSGNLTIDSAGGTVTVDDNLTVTGNLTVSGTTTSINTETLTVDDNIIVLNNNVTSSPTENAGIEVERGTSTNVSVRWNETNDKWEFTNDGSTYGNIAALGTIALGADTTGNYVSSLVAGTGIALTNNSGESATPTVALNATLDNLSDAVIGTVYSIGDTGPAGGKIFITPSTTGNTTGKYFEASPSASEVIRKWASPANITTEVSGAQGTAIGTGAQNTIDIVAQSGNVAESCAAAYASDYSVNGYSDWFLPSQDEIAKLYESKALIGGLENATYWSSTESSNNGAVILYSSVNAELDGTTNGYNKNNDPVHVRAVRSFDQPTASSGDYLKWNGTAWVNQGGVVNTGDTGTVTSTMILNGTIVDADINASAAIVDTKLATIATAGKVSNSATTATDANTANAIVARDASGNFTAGTISASLTGNASTATTLATARNIAGQSFNGSANISIAPTDLTGVTSTAAEINILDGATLSTTELNILDGVTASASELNILDGASLTTTELNYVDGVTSAIQTQLDTKAPLNAPTFTGTVSGISKSMVGLGNVDNTSDANKPVSTAQQIAIDLKANINSPTFTGTVSGINSTMVGLGSVNNTSDQDKPVSTATQTALDLKAPLASPTFSGTPSLPTGTTAVTQTLGNNTTAVATTAFIQTALANFGGMTVSDTAPSVDVGAGDFWYDSTGLNLYIYYGSAWVQITIDEPIFFELSELIGVVIGDLLPNQTLRFDGVSGNWVNSAPRQNVASSSLTTYGVTSANSGGMVVLDSSSAVSVDLGTWTNANIGEKVDIVQKGTGQVSIAVSGAVSVVSPSNSVTTRVRYSTVTATCIGANLFLLSGDLA
jgi:hypothetical protein